MTIAGRADPLRLALSGLAICLCGVSVLAAVATGAGIYFFSSVAAQGADGMVLAWMAWLIAGFAMSVANIVWSAQLITAPTARGMRHVVVTSMVAALSFLVLKAATP